MSTDILAGLLSFLFTIMILSYAVGDNPLFRLALHIFIGIAAGYIAGIAIIQVLLNQLALPFISALQNGNPVEIGILAIPMLMGLLLLTKISPRLEFAGRPIVAFVVGIGAAAAISGAIMETIFPQVQATANLFDMEAAAASGAMLERLVESAFILLGTITSLAYFQFGVRGGAAYTGRRGMVMQAIAVIGQVFIAITFGVLFAGVFSAAVTALIDRVQSLINFIFSLLF